MSIFSEEVMERTELCWKMHAGPPMNNALILLHDNGKYCTGAGVMDVYAKIPSDIASADSSDDNQDAAEVENDVHQQQENAPVQHDLHEEPTPEQHDQQEQDSHQNYQQGTMTDKGKGVKVDILMKQPTVKTMTFSMYLKMIKLLTTDIRQDN